MENSKPTLWEITRLIGSLCSLPQVGMLEFLQKMIFVTTTSGIYKSSNLLTTQ